MYESKLFAAIAWTLSSVRMLPHGATSRLHNFRKHQIPYFRGLAPRGAYRFSKFLVGALNRAGALIKTYDNLDLPFPAHTRTLFIVYDN